MAHQSGSDSSSTMLESQLPPPVKLDAEQNTSETDQLLIPFTRGDST